VRAVSHSTTHSPTLYLHLLLLYSLAAAKRRINNDYDKVHRSTEHRVNPTKHEIPPAKLDSPASEKDESSTESHEINTSCSIHILYHHGRR